MALEMRRSRSLVMAIALGLLLGEGNAIHTGSLAPPSALAGASRMPLVGRRIGARQRGTLMRCFGGGGEEEEARTATEDVQELEDMDDDEEDDRGVHAAQPIRAAFGAKFDSELKAAIFNLAITVTLVAFMCGTRHALAEVIPNPVWIDAFCKILGGCAALQVPMVAILAHREIRAYGLQAFLKRSEVWWGLRVAGLLSLFLALMKAHDVLELSIHNHMEGEIEAQEDADNDAEAAGEEEAFAEEAEEAEVDAVFEAGEDEGTGEGQEEVGGGGKSNWWETALEGLFKATGQELALQGMRVARGEKLTDEEKARIRELEQVQVGNNYLQAPTTANEVDAADEGDADDQAAPPLRAPAPPLRQGAAEAAGDRGAQQVPSLEDMIPEALRPYVWSGILGVCLFTLCQQVSGLGQMRWTASSDLQEEAPVLAGGKQGDLLAGLVATAFEEAGIRRDHFIKTLAAALAAIGSAQGIFSVVAQGSASDGAWLSSPLVRKVSSYNGYMMWIMLSTALRSVGQFDSAAIMYLARPKAASPWGQRGVVSGRVSAHLDKGGSAYRLAAVAKLSDGRRVSHEHTFDLSHFKGGGKGSLRQAAFVEAVRERFIDAVEWEGAEALEEGDDE